MNLSPTPVERVCIEARVQEARVQHVCNRQSRTRWPVLPLIAASRVNRSPAGTGYQKKSLHQAFLRESGYRIFRAALRAAAPGSYVIKPWRFGPPQTYFRHTAGRWNDELNVCGLESIMTAAPPLFDHAPRLASIEYSVPFVFFRCQLCYTHSPYSQNRQPKESSNV